jgi:hypothetical protein
MISMSFGDVERNPDAAARRLMQRAHNQDGLPEIVIGVIFLTTALVLWLPEMFPRWGWIIPLGLMFLVAPMSGGASWLIKKLRRRYLIEKSGYVEFKPANRRRIGIIFGIAFVVAAVTALVVSKGALPSASWLVAGIGIWGGALAAYAGKIPRFVIGGVIMAGVGIVVGLNRFSLGMGQAILYGVMGVLSLCSGVVVLVIFLRKQDEATEV